MPGVFFFFMCNSNSYILLDFLEIWYSFVTAEKDMVETSCSLSKRFTKIMLFPQMGHVSKYWQIAPLFLYRSRAQIEILY